MIIWQRVEFRSRQSIGSRKRHGKISLVFGLVFSRHWTQYSSRKAVIAIGPLRFALALRFREYVICVHINKLHIDISNVGKLLMQEKLLISFEKNVSYAM